MKLLYKPVYTKLRILFISLGVLIVIISFQNCGKNNFQTITPGKIDLASENTENSSELMNDEMPEATDDSDLSEISDVFNNPENESAFDDSSNNSERNISSIVSNSGKTYYVSTSGNNNNPGTISKPFKTIAHAAGKMVAGDTTYVRGGIYFETVNVQFKNSGSSSAPIKLLAYNTEKPIIDFSKASKGRVALLNSRGSKYPIGYVTIEGFEIRNGAVGIHIYNAYNSTFRRNWIHHAMNQGILGNGKNIVVDRNVVNRVGNFAGCLAGTIKCYHEHGIYGTGPSWKITNNLIYDNLGYGVHIAGYPNCPQGYCVSKTYAYKKVYTDDSYGGASGWLIANNTIAYNNYRSAIVLWLPLTTKSKIINNIFFENSQKYGSGNNGVDFVQSPGGGHEIRNNICYATSPGATACLGSSGKGKYTGTNITANPNFVGAGPLISGAPNFKLKAGSPAINRGVSLNEVLRDILGVARPRGGAYDIGAYEF